MDENKKNMAAKIALSCLICISVITGLVYLIEFLSS